MVMDSEEHKVKDSPTRQGKGKTNEKESVDEGERQHPNSTRPMPFDNVESNSTTKAQSQRDEGDGAPKVEELEEPFTSPRKPPPVVYTPQLDLMWLVLLGLAAGTRLLNLSTPNHVVFDEVHFGRFTSYFMQRRFFFDVHPPLGKLLFALTGYLSGFDGNFMFEEIGQSFGNHENQVWYLRLMPAIFSTLLVPCVYEILVELGCSYWMATFGAFLVIFENMLVVQGRFILMDSPLVFFIALSICCYIKFLREHNRSILKTGTSPFDHWPVHFHWIFGLPFQLWWWIYLVSLGVAITGAFSIKYNGLLTVVLIAGLTMYDLWKLLGDVAVSLKSLGHHFLARAGCLFGLPVFLYLFQFYVLFAVLVESGPHDDMMSSAFQRTLKGGLARITEHQAHEVAYGSQITLRNTHHKQCWLHSHNHLYPVKYPDGRGSSAQQQVTCYAFKDINNWWIIKDPSKESLMVQFPPKYVKNGDIIQLVHGTTGRGLNSHDVAAPLNPHYMEVSGYVDHNVSMDAQFGWKVDILNPDGSNIWKAIQSQVRLVHVNTSASMKVTGALLPEWGFNQFEVGPARIARLFDAVKKECQDD